MRIDLREDCPRPLHFYQNLFSLSKLLPRMSRVTCKHNCNQPIYLALLHKTNTFSADEDYHADIFRMAAETIAEWDYNLYDHNNPAPPYLGPRINKFIQDCINQPITLGFSAIVNEPLSFTVPENKPIYKALMDKAASYPPDKPYQAKAYRTAAESIRNYGINLYDCDETLHIDGVGDKIADFISNFIRNSTYKAQSYPLLTRIIQGNLVVPQVPLTPEEVYELIQQNEAAEEAGENHIPAAQFGHFILRNSVQRQALIRAGISRPVWMDTTNVKGQRRSPRLAKAALKN
jgi:hypothetical protein